MKRIRKETKSILSTEKEHQINLTGALPCYADFLMKSKKKHAEDVAKKTTNNTRGVITSRMLSKGLTLFADTALTDEHILKAQQTDPNYCRVNTPNPIYGADALIEGNEHIEYEKDITEIRQIVIDIDRNKSYSWIEKRFKSIGCDRLWEAAAIVGKTTEVDDKGNPTISTTDNTDNETRWHIFVQVTPIRVMCTRSSFFRYIKHIVDMVLDPENGAVSYFERAAAYYESHAAPFLRRMDPSNTENETSMRKITPAMNRIYLQTFRLILSEIDDMDAIPDHQKNLIREVYKVASDFYADLKKYAIDENSDFLVGLAVLAQRMLSISLTGDTNCGGINHPINCNSFNYEGAVHKIDGDNDYVCIKPATRSISLETLVSDIAMLNSHSEDPNDKTRFNVQYAREWIKELVSTGLLTNCIAPKFVMDRGEIRRRISQEKFLFPAEVISFYSGGRLGFSFVGIRTAFEYAYRGTIALRNMFKALITAIEAKIDDAMATGVYYSAQNKDAVPLMHAHHRIAVAAYEKACAKLDALTDIVRRAQVTKSSIYDSEFSRIGKDLTITNEERNLWFTYDPNAFIEEATPDEVAQYRDMLNQKYSEFIIMAKDAWIKGQRNNTALALSHKMYSAHVSLDDAKRAVEYIANMTQDEELEGRLRTVEGVYRWRTEHGSHMTVNSLETNCMKRLMRKHTDQETKMQAAFRLSDDEEADLRGYLSSVFPYSFQERYTPETTRAVLSTKTNNIKNGKNRYIADIRASIVDYVLLTAAQHDIAIADPTGTANVGKEEAAAEFTHQYNILKFMLFDEANIKDHVQRYTHSELNEEQFKSRTIAQFNKRMAFYTYHYVPSSNTPPRTHRLREFGLVTIDEEDNGTLRLHITPQGTKALAENVRMLYLGKDHYVPILMGKGYLPTDSMTLHHNDTVMIAKKYGNNLMPIRNNNHRLDTEAFSFITDECFISYEANRIHYRRGRDKQVCTPQTHYRTNLYHPEAARPVETESSEESSGGSAPTDTAVNRIIDDIVTQKFETTIVEAIYRNNSSLRKMPSQFALFSACTVIKEVMYNKTKIFPITQSQIASGLTRERLLAIHKNNMAELVTTKGWKKFNLSRRTGNKVIAANELYTKTYNTARTHLARETLFTARAEKNRAHYILDQMDSRTSDLDLIMSLDREYAIRRISDLTVTLRKLASTETLDERFMVATHLNATTGGIITDRIYRQHLCKAARDLDTMTASERREWNSLIGLHNRIQFRLNNIETRAMRYTKTELIRRYVAIFQFVITYYVKALIFRNAVRKSLI